MLLATASSPSRDGTASPRRQALMTISGESQSVLALAK
jgi:hypothetical protein